jgi:hypothetical protein
MLKYFSYMFIGSHHYLKFIHAKVMKYHMKEKMIMHGELERNGKETTWPTSQNTTLTITRNV